VKDTQRRSITSHHWLLALALATTSSIALAQAPAVLVAGLKAPIKLALTEQGNLLVAEAGAGPNTGRVSLAERNGNVRTILDGLPAGLAAPNNDPSGVEGLVVRGDTLFIVIGVGDVARPGPRPGTEVPNPEGPSSPILSSVIKARFNAPVDQLTGGFGMTPADHMRLADGHEVTLSNANGEQAKLELLTDFRDYVPDPNIIVRPSHPFGAVLQENSLFVVDAAMNTINRVEARTGRSQVLVRFASLPNPTPVGPPLLDAVPNSIHRVGDQLLVTLLTGFPFPPDLAEVRIVDIESGRDRTLIRGLTMAIDVLPIARGERGFLVLEFSTNPAAQAPGRLLRFDSPQAAPVVLNDQLTSPTSMVFDPQSGDLFITEIFAGRIVRVGIR
jgi:hypothetical protein